MVADLAVGAWIDMVVKKKGDQPSTGTEISV